MAHDKIQRPSPSRPSPLAVGSHMAEISWLEDDGTRSSVDFRSINPRTLWCWENLGGGGGGRGIVARLADAAQKPRNPIIVLEEVEEVEEEEEEVDGASVFLYMRAGRGRVLISLENWNPIRPIRQNMDLIFAIESRRKVKKKSSFARSFAGSIECLFNFVWIRMNLVCIYIYTERERL